MYRITPSIRCTYRGKGLSKTNVSPKFSTFGSAIHEAPRLVTRLTRPVQCIKVPELSYAKQSHHVRQVAVQLRGAGILKISLQFQDPNSKYLEHLLSTLHQNHGHRLPIRHSAHRGWFWDVRPSTTNFQAGSHQARSETMSEFPWHTDCSYEDQPPRYFALQVLQHDRYGGGTLSVMNVKSLIEHLSPATRTYLSRPEYQITVPQEFIKDPNRRSILGSILVANDDHDEVLIRFRSDILSAQSQRASHALEELRATLQDRNLQSSLALHLSPEDLPAGSIVLIDNRRWLHARNHINDPERHLRRVRWDAMPFESNSS